ncbi:hypothetical protein [Flavobacterium sp. LS2R12]|uniref:hypothetical protein n=1 Tax=unclassified Flavobacterium TaxID=196869 RepID=UPI003AAC5677
MELNQFKELINNSSALIPSKLEEAYVYLNIPKTGDYLSRDISNNLYEKIRNALSVEETENIIKTKKILSLKDELVFRKVLYGENPDKYLQVFKVIRDASAKELKYFPTTSTNWTEAIQFAQDYLKFSPDTFSLYKDLRDEYPKEFDRATAAKRLEQYGCSVEVENSEIIISNLNLVFEGMSKKIENVGGLTLARIIFRYLAENLYSTIFERYRVSRHTSTIAYHQKPQIPFGYLLNLCASFPFDKQKTIYFQRQTDEIFNLATDIAIAVYYSQPYSQWEYILADGDKIVNILTEIALWDSIYSVPQSKPALALEIAFGIFEQFPDEKFRIEFGHTKRETELVCYKIVEQIKDINGPVEIDFKTLSKRLYRLKKNKIEQILDIFSHTQSINTNYHEPSDYLKIDFNFKPLIKTGKLKYLVMDKSWCAPSYYEAIASKIRETNKRLDQQLGHPIEDFLHRKFKQKGIVALTGDYTYLGQAGECDFLIESDKSIILIEAKKKPLTRKSKSGNDIDIIVDLSSSVLEAQRQAGRTAIVLMESGSIELKQTDGSIKVVYLNGREIERIALTQLEYGGFQDRITMENFLKSLLTHTITTTSNEPQIIKKFDDLASKQQVWIEQYNKFKDLDPNIEHWAYRNCWFFSLPQILELINLSSCNKSFEKALKATKYVSMGTMDWYSEYEYTIKMNQN